MAAFDERAAERLLAGLRVRGELDVLIALVRDRARNAQDKINAALLKRVLKTPEQWADLQFHQGKMKALVELMADIQQLALLGPERQPSRRPDE